MEVEQDVGSEDAWGEVAKGAIKSGRGFSPEKCGHRGKNTKGFAIR